MQSWDVSAKADQVGVPGLAQPRPHQLPVTSLRREAELGQGRKWTCAVWRLQLCVKECHGDQEPGE